MPRPVMTPLNRFVAVKIAHDSLTDALTRAAECIDSYGYDDARTLAAWERVETLGATIHRQSRLLAGKSKGG